MKINKYLATFLAFYLILITGVSTIEAKNRKVTVYLTTSDRSNQLKQLKLKTKKVKEKDQSNTIKLVSDIKYQTMDGFGAAVTGSASYNLMKMSAINRKDFLEKTFSDQKGYGHSYVRVAIGCSDFSLSEYTCCDKQGIENFSLTDEELTYVIPVLKEILTINPHVKIMAAPWTAPRWMKIKEIGSTEKHYSWTAGHVNPAYYQDYATYFVKWIQAFEKEGINIYAVTPQNEPLNPGNSASTLMYWDEQRAFIKEALGPKFAQNNIQTKIYVFDHNYNYDDVASQNDYPLNIYKDDAADKFIAGAAYHNYNGDKDELNQIHKARVDKELVFTETSIGTWNDGRNLEKRLIEDMEEVALGTVNNWCKGVIVWNLILDMERGPNREGGCQSCYGAVDIDQTNYSDMVMNSHYFIISHLSAVVKPGAVRIDSKNGNDLKGITSSAFINPDGSHAVVLSNSNYSTKDIKIRVKGKKMIQFTCPARSVVSFKW